MIFLPYGYYNLKIFVIRVCKIFQTHHHTHTYSPSTSPLLYVSYDNFYYNFIKEEEK